MKRRREKKISAMVSRHFPFQQKKNSATIDQNITKITKFNSPRDSGQVGFMGRHLDERHLTIEA